MERPAQVLRTSLRGVVLTTTLATCMLLASCVCQPPPEQDAATPTAGDSPPSDQADGAQPAPPPADTPETPTPQLSCLDCHRQPQGSRGPVVADSNSDGHSAALTDANCVLYHDTSRHGDGHVRLWRTPFGQGEVLALQDDPAEDAASADTLTPFCLNCHRGAQYDVHQTDESWRPACATCHDFHSPGSANSALARPAIATPASPPGRAVVLTARTGSGSFGDGDQPVDGICQVCHTSTDFHRGDGGGSPHFVGQDCIVCHTHVTGFRADGTACIACHSQPQGTRPRVVNADGSGGHHQGRGRLSDSDCVACHDMSQHMRGTIRVWGDPINRTAAMPVTEDREQLTSMCLGCHDQADHPTIHTTGAAWEPACTDCHDLHDPASENLTLVSRTIFGTPITFQDNDASGDGLTDFIQSNHDPVSYDGVCEVCHTDTLHHRNSANGDHAHFADQRCTDCHPHNAGFVPTAGSCTDCHSASQGNRPAVVNPDGSGGHHLAGGVLSDDDCVICHEMSQHQQGDVRLWEDPTNPTTPLIVTGGPAELIVFCDACHVGMTHPTTHTVAGTWEPACTECHELHDLPNANLSLVRDMVHNNTLDQDMAVVFTARTGPNSFNDGDPATNDGICQVCHTNTSYHRYDGSGTVHNNGSDCTTCHPHNADFIPLGGTSCIGCHSQSQGSRPAVVNADGSGGHHLQGGVLTDDDCVVCHEMSQHQMGGVRLWEDPTNPTTPLVVTGDPAELIAFCDACHVGMTHPTIHTVGGGWEPACTECHELHDLPNANLSLVRDMVHNNTLDQDMPVVFTARTGPNSFDDGDPAANDGICQVCHTDTNYHRYDGSGTVHNNGSDCTACHPHNAGFIPAGGTSCIVCHGVPQDNGDGIPPGGRRAVLDDFGRSSHHIQGDVQNDDCAVCHDMAAHQQGHVRLQDPDDGGVVYVYDEATPDDLESFCLHCHDTDGALAGNGTQPFSDGQTVPDIDESGAWAISAHATGGATSSGLTCVDCHGNGHGSNLLRLLLPWDGAAGPDNANEEEGFCYGCHGSGGVINEAISNGLFAGSYENFADNVETAFGMASFHPVNDSAPGHVFDIGGGPQELECTTCHGVHRNTGKYWEAPSDDTPVSLFPTGELWGDDPSEKIGQYDVTKTYQAPFIGEPGLDLSGNPLPIDGAGNSLLTDTVSPDYNALCLTCHQQALGGLVAVNWVNSKHGSAEAEPEGPAGSPLVSPFDSAARGQYFLECLNCHEAHGSENISLIKRSANGGVVPGILDESSAIEWNGLCGQCHVSGLQNRHHNHDVWHNKLGMPPGRPDCSVCHDPFPFVNCTTSGCHGHPDWF